MFCVFLSVLFLVFLERDFLGAKRCLVHTSVCLFAWATGKWLFSRAFRLALEHGLNDGWFY